MNPVRLGSAELERLAQAEVSVPCADLADGTYEVELRTLFDGARPGPEAPTLRWPFYVLRGYQVRAELAMGKAVELRKELEPLPRAADAPPPGSNICKDPIGARTTGKSNC